MSRESRSEPLTVEEFDELIAARVRAGDVDAMRLWHELYGAELGKAAAAERLKLKLVGDEDGPA